MQNPTSEEGAILKREWWQPWTKDIPTLKHVIQSYDTAFSKKETADYSELLHGEYSRLTMEHLMLLC